MQRFYLTMRIHAGWNFRKGQETYSTSRPSALAALSVGRLRAPQAVQTAVDEPGEGRRPGENGDDHEQLRQRQQERPSRIFATWYVETEYMPNGKTPPQ